MIDQKSYEDRFEEWLSKQPESDEKAYDIRYGGDGERSIAQYVFNALTSQPALIISDRDLYLLLIHARIGAIESGDIKRYQELIDKLKITNPDIFKKL